jgi:hypothetical protein
MGNGTVMDFLCITSNCIHAVFHQSCETPDPPHLGHTRGIHLFSGVKLSELPDYRGRLKCMVNLPTPGYSTTLLKYDFLTLLTLSSITRKYNYYIHSNVKRAILAPKMGPKF